MSKINKDKKDLLNISKLCEEQKIEIQNLKTALINAGEKLLVQDKEKGKRAAELGIANKELLFEDSEKEKRAAELEIANKELQYQRDEKEKRAQELTIANKELAFQNKEKEKRAAELSIANIELAYQNEEKEKRAEELMVANKVLVFENKEKEKRAAELIIANAELAFQNEEKEKRAAELKIANKELAFQNKEKEKRAAELSIANIELAYQNEQKQQTADELTLANKKLVFENKEKEKRAAELVLANEELAYQNKEKENRASELSVANKELAYQNKEKEKRAAELSMANIELAYQNEEKEKRAAELIIANNQLVFENNEKEKRAAELIIINKELSSFTFISSHHLQEPLRKIQTFVSVIIDNEQKSLTIKGKNTLERMRVAAERMQLLINDLLTLSNISTTKLIFERTDLKIIIEEVRRELAEDIKRKRATINITGLGQATIIRFQFCQMMVNLISNAIKFSQPGIAPHIIISSKNINTSNTNNTFLLADKNYCQITIQDNGIGFEQHHADRIFEVFQQIHDKETYGGTGMGLAVVKKIVKNHNGVITATSEPNKGTAIDIYLPII